MAVNGEQSIVLNERTRSVISPSFYYVGLSGFGGTFRDWAYSGISPSKQYVSFGFTNMSDIDLLGTASIVDDKLRLTAGGSQSGVGVYSAPIYAHTGFNSTVVWTPTNCDQANNGADG